MSSMLLTHRGAIRLDRAQLANIPAPEPTDTWKPVSRAQLVSALTDILIIRGFAIKHGHDRLCWVSPPLAEHRLA
jgi:hypothetical protein